MSRLRRNLLPVLALAPLTLGVGCFHTSGHTADTPTNLPKELNKVTLPEHIIEPPDILQINAVQLIPLPPYKVQSLDVLAIQVPNALPAAPISGLYTVEPDGTINLGLNYGSVKVVGMTTPEAKAAIEELLRAQLKMPEVSVAVAQARGVQQIAGPHLVRTDGTIFLGTYGSVSVTGMTLAQARLRIEEYLAPFLQSPQITVDVLAYNSKVYYVIFDGGGLGHQITRLPVTGNDTVLDALSQLGGTTAVSDKHHIWIARPSPAEACCDQILPVDLAGIMMKGRTATNYQLMPGDRIYVQAKPMIALDNAMARVFAPIERLFGITLLGNSLYRQFATPVNTSGSNNNTAFP